MNKWYRFMAWRLKLMAGSVKDEQGLIKGPLALSNNWSNEPQGMVCLLGLPTIGFILADFARKEYKPGNQGKGRKVQQDQTELEPHSASSYGWNFGSASEGQKITRNSF
ncbi:hypothetical protein L1049_012313 [Liquidambar formosana]|uniref:Uncharacterized protein n=1 Tax=Liquidambar formosana TaxID=63359 RepID=A0AAP0RTH7_LIQFO